MITLLVKTRRPLSTGIISATRLLLKKVWRNIGINPRPTGWETRKNSKHQPGFEPTTYWLGKQLVKCTSHHGVEIKWSFGRTCKKRIIDHDFLPPFLRAENKSSNSYNNVIVSVTKGNNVRLLKDFVKNLYTC